MPLPNAVSRGAVVFWVTMFSLCYLHFSCCKGSQASVHITDHLHLSSVILIIAERFGNRPECNRIVFFRFHCRRLVGTWMSRMRTSRISCFWPKGVYVNPGPSKILYLRRPAAFEPLFKISVVKAYSLDGYLTIGRKGHSNSRTCEGNFLSIGFQEGCGCGDIFL